MRSSFPRRWLYLRHMLAVELVIFLFPLVFCQLLQCTHEIGGNIAFLRFCDGRRSRLIRCRVLREVMLFPVCLKRRGGEWDGSEVARHVDVVVYRRSIVETVK